MINLKRSDCLWLVRPSNRKINVVRVSDGESKEHQNKKREICEQLLAQGKFFVTEAIFKKGGRADILVLDDFRVIEIVHTETEGSIVKKRQKYPSGLTLEVVRC